MTTGRNILQVWLPLSAAFLILSAYLLRDRLINLTTAGDMISKIEVPFAGVKAVPDPTQVITTWDWYFLDQVSSSLVKWSSERNSFEGVLAESWSFDENSITFTLKPNLKFSGGESLTAHDVAASVKRTLIKKNTSHFKPWDLLVDCGDLKSINQDCPGLSVLSDTKIRFNLRYPSESFFLYMACPEGGVWSKKDLVKNEFSPTTFSGSYAVKEKIESGFILSFNANWVLSERFKKRPTEIVTNWSADVKTGLASGKTDIVLDLERPFAMQAPSQDLYTVKRTAFNTLYYLFKVSGAKNSYGRNCLEKLWNKEFPEWLTPATSYLPLEGLSGIDKDQILRALPDTPCTKIRIGYLQHYFSEEFIQFLFEDGAFEMVPLNHQNYYSSFSKNYDKAEFDYVLTPYVASERYPSAQISFMMEDRTLPFDLSILDHRDDAHKKKEMLGQIQDWTIKTQQIIPLVFGRCLMVYKSNINIGNQPIVDSELQLWRVNE